MASAVDVDVGDDAVAALAGEAVLAVALLRRALVTFHRQVVVGNLQLPVGRLGIELEGLASGEESSLLICWCHVLSKPFMLLCQIKWQR